MTEINFTVLGNPKAQQRHRTFRRGNFNINVDPSAKDKESFLLTIKKEAPDTPIISPIEMDIRFYFARPKSHYRTGKNAGMLRVDAPDICAKKPDIDNCIKFVMDSMNGVYFKDDSQIWRVLVVKKYDDMPRTEITIIF